MPVEFTTQILHNFAQETLNVISAATQACPPGNLAPFPGHASIVVEKMGRPRPTEMAL